MNLASYMFQNYNTADLQLSDLRVMSNNDTITIQEIEDILHQGPTTNVLFEIAQKKGKLHPFGIEKTFVKPVWYQGCGEKNEYTVQRHLENVAGKICDLLTVPVYNCGTDPGCVEISSVPMTSMKSAKLFFEDTSRLAVGKYKLKHQYPAVYGTGGHIHIEDSSEWTGFSSALWSFGSSNPWLNLFADTGDDSNAPSYGLVHLNNIVMAYQDLILNGDRCFYREAFQQGTFLDIASCLDVIVELTDRVCSTTPDASYTTNNALDMISKSMQEYRSASGHVTLKPRSKTFEFRCFGTVSGWAEQKLHIDFVQAVVAHCKENKKAWKKSQIDGRSMIELSLLEPTEMKAGFVDMLDMLGLPLVKYERYLKRAEERYSTDQERIKSRMVIYGHNEQDYPPIK